MAVAAWKRITLLILVLLTGIVVSGIVIGLQILVDQHDRMGIIDFPTDHDKALRRSFLSLDDGETVYDACSFKLAYAFLQTQAGFSIVQDPANPSRIRLGKGWLIPLESNDGGDMGADARGFALDGAVPSGPGQTPRSTC